MSFLYTDKEAYNNLVQYLSKNKYSFRVNIVNNLYYIYIDD